MIATLQRHAALLLGASLLMVGFGLTTSLVSIQLAQRGLTHWVGWVGSAYFFGLGVGSLRGERTIAEIGYVRAYGLLTAVACFSVLLLIVVDHPMGWLVGRMLQGFALGGIFVCLESWLGSSTLPENRGRVLGLYQVVLYLGLALGQLMLGVLASTPSTALVWAAMLLCLASLPVGATKVEAPILVVQPRLRLRELWGTASLGILGAVVSGITTGSIYTVAPAAGVMAGLSEQEVAWLMAAFIGGGLVLQIPLGRASDLYDRRLVLAAIGAAAALGGGMSMLLVGSPTALIMISAFEGGWVFAIYAISLGYTFDRVAPERLVSANAALLATFCAGSAVGAGGSSAALAIFGPVGFFGVLALPPAAMSVAALRAAAIWTAVPVEDRGVVVLVPRTSAALVELDPRVDVDPARNA